MQTDITSELEAIIVQKFDQRLLSIVLVGSIVKGILILAQSGVSPNDPKSLYK